MRAGSTPPSRPATSTHSTYPSKTHTLVLQVASVSCRSPMRAGSTPPSRNHCCTGGLLATHVATTSAARHLSDGWRQRSSPSSGGRPPILCRSVNEGHRRAKGTRGLLNGDRSSAAALAAAGGRPPILCRSVNEGWRQRKRERACQVGLVQSEDSVAALAAAACRQSCAGL